MFFLACTPPPRPARTTPPPPPSPAATPGASRGSAAPRRRPTRAGKKIYSNTYCNLYQNYSGCCRTKDSLIPSPMAGACSGAIRVRQVNNSFFSYALFLEGLRDMQPNKISRSRTIFFSFLSKLPASLSAIFSPPSFWAPAAIAAASEDRDFSRKRPFRKPLSSGPTVQLTDKGVGVISGLIFTALQIPSPGTFPGGERKKEKGPDLFRPLYLELLPAPRLPLRRLQRGLLF